ncbi:phospholipid/cholesterol/gamma-HCH transport system substrate-binding protein [Tamaricihabitans halophyticus]|uniref:Phospholipid/cholesterol/gamma-HCH transport system substrate-binding protein n=1 Tax=Tamaricihabitans halophyticus TaxID=1262583 RepID=A0A4R2QTD0_9PSEU|nr:MCE family protein [Tamaricihabitans halophyticus]TCP53190.1 phospholipid/cholesterol/gamma-HCH transport system substrate-binding protein [Tamaricihabitans halophyticus]
MRRGIRSARLALASALAAILLAGCGITGAYDIPLPGGADLGENPYQVRVQFRDVLDLVPQSGVKVNDVPVGRVEKVGLAKDGWTAEVTLLINGDVRLPANATAQLRQSSLLGEKFVQLSNPADGTPAEGSELSDGGLIPVDRTNRNTEVEEVLGALSMLLNGGGVDQLRTITRELNNVTEGNEGSIRSLLGNVRELTENLDAHSGDITRALDSVNRLSTTLVQQRDQIGNAIDNLGPGLEVLNAQRGQLVTMLQSLRKLSGVAVDTVNKSKEDLVADLKALAPTLQKLAEAGTDLPQSLELLFTIPFTDAAIEGTKGDFVNLYADLDLNVDSLLQNLSRSRTNPLDGLPLLGDLAEPTQGEKPGAPPPLPLPDSASAPAPEPPGGSPNSDGAAPPASGASGIFGVLTGGGA